MKFSYLFFFSALLGSLALTAQEVNFTVTVNAQKLQTTDPQVFLTLQNTITEFLNTNKWTNDVFEPSERINGNLVLTIQEELETSSGAPGYKAEIAIQSSRPVFGSNYETPMLNHMDREVSFTYEQFQPLRFSRNAYNDNLSSVLAYYIYIILGLDYDSFSPFGGEPYFQLALEILNSVPAGAGAGWTALDGNRNRYWIIENLLSPRVRPLRQALYDYHRQSLDLMHKDALTGRTIMMDAIEAIGEVNQTYPNSMIVQMFMNAKSDEMVEIFKNSTQAEKDRAVRTLNRIDAANASKYRVLR